MHELPVTEDILRIVTEHGKKAGATRVTAVHLVIGQLAGFIDDSIQFYFDILSPGTLAEGAQLQFERVPTRLRCRDCGNEFPPAELDWRCPSCGSMGGDVISGKEFYVDSIEVD
jgi:hydrogenase nickel incorporation protein HypA/HybF